MASQPTFTIPAAVQAVPLAPSSLIADGMVAAFAAPAALIAWAQNASPREATIYARAHRLPCGSPIAAAARLLQEGGFIQINHQRSNSVLPWHYVARRTDRPMHAGLRRERPAPSLNPEQARLFADLVRLADAGVACPSNSELALRSGLANKAFVAAHLTVLERRNLIRRHLTPTFDRVVEIVETGARTAGIVL